MKTQLHRQSHHHFQLSTTSDKLLNLPLDSHATNSCNADNLHTSHRSKVCQLGLLLLTSLEFIWWQKAVSAQIEPDNTLGAESSIVTPQALRDLIEGGAIRDTNLFHSFAEFNVNEGQNVYFANPEGIVNILTRVTGANPSDIFGTLGVDGAANLILLNPNGINFGGNASLNLGGSFFASTAQSIIFADGTEFSTNQNQNQPLLTVKMPIGLGLGVTPGDITLQNSKLQVSPGQTLALIGGNVTLQGDNLFSNLATQANLYAPGGRVELGGLSTTGIINFLADGSLAFPEGVTRGDVTLTDAAAVNVQSDKGGSIAVNARVLEMFDQSVLWAGIEEGKGELDVDARVLNRAGDITINATDRVTLVGNGIPRKQRFSEQSSDTNISNSVGLRPSSDEGKSTARGLAGDIYVNTNILELRNVARINSSAFGIGGSGQVVIEANQVSFLGNSSNQFQDTGIVTEVFDANSSFDVGDIIINADVVTLTDKSIVNTLNVGSGSSGNITINAESVSLDQQSIAFSFVSGNASGKGGRVEINADFVTLNNTSKLQAQTIGTGDVGGIFINNANTVSLSSIPGVGNETQILSSTQGGGKSEGIFISADTISLDNNALIFSWIPRGSGITGNIEINTNSFILNNNSRIQSQVLSEAQGSAGDIIINAAHSLTLNNDSRIETIYQSQADSVTEKAGDIEINTGSLLIDDSNLIANTEGNANAGNIIIRAQDRVTFNDGTAQAEVGIPLFGNETAVIARGNSGGIDITAQDIFLANFSIISVITRPETQGETGNITLDAETISIDSGSTVSGVTQNLSNGGDVFVTANVLNIESQGKIATSTSSSGEAGNIILNITDRLTLADSKNVINPPDDFKIETGDIVQALGTGIFANASDDSTGDGGNITITIEDGFLIAFPAQGNQGSDIIANAFSGDGGRVKITASGIFGIEFRDNLTPANDITVTSVEGSAGIVELDTPDTNPAEGLENLPEIPTNPQPIRGCGATGEQGDATFVDKGRGGSPSNPYEPLSNGDIWEDIQPPTQQVVEAQGWTINENGHLELVTAQAANRQFRCDVR